MQNLETLGRWILALGIGIVIVGGLIWLVGKLTGLRSLPGTLKLEFSGITCVFPILASIVLSVVLTVALNLIIRWMNR